MRYIAFYSLGRYYILPTRERLSLKTANPTNITNKSITPVEIANYSKQWAKRFARRLSLAAHIEDEMAQEAAIGIMRAQEKFIAKKGDFLPYAFMWAMAYMRKHANKLGGTVNFNGHMPDCSGEMPIQKTDPVSDDTVDFRRKLAEAPTRTQDVINRRMAGETFQDIASHHNISRETVRQVEQRFAFTVHPDETKGGDA